MKSEKRRVGKHGGARPGAGRPITGRITATVSIRHHKDVIDAVRQKYPGHGEITKLGQQWLESLVT